MKKKYYKESMDAKIALYYMVGQCYSGYITKEAASRLNVSYNDSDVTINNDVEVYAHGYDPVGQRAWHALGMEKSIIPFSEYWKKDISERELENKNYQQAYLELCLLLLKLTPMCYSYSITEEAADKMHLDYSDVDVVDGKLEVYDHFFETAGEKTWNVLSIPSAKVPALVFKEKEQEIKKKLLELK